MENNLEGLLEENLKALKASKRKRVRAALTNDPNNLADQVAQSASDFREEFIQLQKDHDEALKTINLYEQEVEMLKADVETLSYMEDRHKLILKRLYGGDLCPICNHSLQCYSVTCTNCAKKICDCCDDWCGFVDTDKHTCHNRICTKCKNDFGTCPVHRPNLSEEEKKEKNQSL
jgi:hypothetical protein